MTTSANKFRAEGVVRSPFVHKFCTKQHKYLFDVNTSRVLRVPAVVWDIVEDVGVLAKSAIVAKYSQTYPASAVSEGYDAVLAAQEKGLLSANRPVEVVAPYSEEYLREQLAHSRQSLILVVTEQCNFRCSYCVYGGQYSYRRLHSGTTMTWEIARRVIDEFLEHSGEAKGRSVRFYGGEPLLNFPLVRQCVEYIHQERGQTDVQFALVTNGYLLRAEAADFIAKHEMRLAVSLDGPEQIHDRYRHLKDGSGTWRQIIENLRAFLKEHPEYTQNSRLRFHAVVAPPVDLRDLEEFFGTYDLFEPGMHLSLGSVSNLDTTLGECSPFDGGKVQGYEALYERFFRNMRDGTLGRDHDQPAMWMQTAAFESTVKGFYKRGHANKEHPRLPERLCTLPMCVPGVRRLFVQADGSYYPCERVQETEPFRIGSVEEGISAKRVHDLLQAFVDLSKAECPSCWCLPICQAGCVTAVMKDGKPDSTARKEACEGYRKTAHRTMMDVAEALEANPDALRYMDAITFY